MRLRTSLLLIALLPLPATGQDSKIDSPEIGSLEFLGQARIESGSEFDGTLVGGLSGITYDARLDRYYAISDDPNHRSPSRFYTLDIDLGEGELTEERLRVERATRLLDRQGRPFEELVIDGEGIAVTLDRTLLVSSEGNVKRKVPPSIREVDLDGRELREIGLPKLWRPRWDEPFGVRHNQALEALTVVPGQPVFFAATENAIHQDGPETDVGQGARSRIVRYDLASAKAGAHYVYDVEPVVFPPLVGDAFRTNGLVDLLALDEHRLIALERSYTVGLGNSIRLYLISVEGADDVRKIKSLAGRSDVRPVAKRLLLDLAELGIPLDNVEGLTLGPPLPDGRATLILVSDDNFSAEQFTQVLAFAMSSERATPSAIQGTAHRSPLEGRWVFGVSGVVTAADLDGRRRGFWIQDPNGDADPATSDAVFVAAGDAGQELDPPVAAGDLVSVTGRVAEAGRPGALPVTRIDALEVEVESRRVALPAALRLGGDGLVVPAIVDDDRLGSFDPQDDAIDFWESLEGMRVTVVEPRVVGPLTRFGTFTVVPGAEPPAHATASGGLLLLDGDANPQRLVVDPSLSSLAGIDVGQPIAAPLVGVLDYAFNNYRLVTTEAVRTVRAEDASRGRSALTAGNRQLTVATYNVENLDAGDNPEKFSRVARTIIEGLGSPDLLALQEIQDDNGTLDDGTVSAARTLGLLTEAILDAGGPDYSFIQIDPQNNADGGAPGGNIRAAFLFNPLRLALARSPGLLPTNPVRLAVDSPAFQADEESGFKATRKPLAAEFLFGDHRLLAVNVHLKSKRGDDPIFGWRQPPARATERQRLAQTAELGRKLQAVLDSDPEAMVILLGDFNDHEFREPMKALEGFGLVNLTPRVDADERYSYIYEGNSQTIDHILVSPALARLAPAVEIVHLNADFSAADRASDHDPVLAGFSLDLK